MLGANCADQPQNTNTRSIEEVAKADRVLLPAVTASCCGDVLLQEVLV